MTALHLDPIVVFSHSEVKPVTEIIKHQNVLSGEYQTTTWLHYSNEKKGFTSGIWEGHSCKEAFTSEQDEFCHILSGIVRLTDGHGNSADYGRGESFVIPAGFNGVWENIGPVTKLFVIA